MALIDAETAPTFDIPDARFTGLASPSRGARETSVWRVRLAPGAQPVRHRLTREEVFVAVAGNAQAWLAGAELVLSAGSALIVPANTEFALGNAGPEPFEAVVALPVGGMARVGEGDAFVPPWAA